MAFLSREPGGYCCLSGPRYRHSVPKPGKHMRLVAQRGTDIAASSCTHVLFRLPRDWPAGPFELRYGDASCGSSKAATLQVQDGRP